MIATTFTFRLAARVAALLVLAIALGSGNAAAQRGARAGPLEPSSIPWVHAGSEQALLTAIAQYQRIAAAGGWPILPARTTLRPGDSDARVGHLRRRLVLGGDLSAREGSGYSYDGAVEAAVKRYQRRHGLLPNGIVYGITQRSLSVSVEDRIRQLEQNLARVRNLAQRLAQSPRFILMNSASFELQAIENGQVAMASRTIVGTRATPTPEVSAQLRAVNILPYWHVPASIAKRALIPMIRKDPTYLYREHIRVFSSFGGEEIDPATVNWHGPEALRYVFRQDPGPHNALGLIRFDMPNKHIVYLHDTPMKQLFGSYERSFSAGCVRVQDFYRLAEWVANGQDGWTGAQFQAAAAAGKPITVKLKSPVPVHFIYLTSWVEDGDVQFRNDLYNLDAGAEESGDDPASRVLVQTIAP